MFCLSLAHMAYVGFYTIIQLTFGYSQYSCLNNYTSIIPSWYCHITMTKSFTMSLWKVEDMIFGSHSLHRGSGGFYGRVRFCISSEVDPNFANLARGAQF